MATLRQLLPLLAVLAWPIAGHAQDSLYDGYDNDGDGEVDEQDEYGGGGSGMGQTEQMCNMTGRLDYCLQAHTMYCQQFGVPGACALAEIGAHCNGGDPGQCQYYQQVIGAAAACQGGDGNACGWIRAQPVGWAYGG